MYVNGIFEAGPAVALVNSTIDWQEGDIIEHEGHFLSFFVADGNKPHKLKTLRALVDYWQKVDRNGQQEISNAGFFIMEPKFLNAKVRSQLGLDKTIPDDPVVGVVAADTRTLAKQFNYAKRVLKRLGVCNNDLPCRLRVETKEEDLVSVRKVKTETLGSKIAAKLGISLPSNPVMESSIELESSLDNTHTLEQSREWKLDHGAMKSALLMNRIALGAGVSDLNALAKFETRRNVYLMSFAEERHQELSMQYMEDTLEKLQQERELLLQNIIKLFEQCKRFMIQNWTGALRTIQTDENLFAMQASFENTIALCQKGQITKESMLAMRDMEELGRQVIPNSWFERIGEFGAHAMLLVACLDDSIQEQQAALDLMKEQLQNQQDEEDEAEQRYQRPRM